MSEKESKNGRGKVFGIGRGESHVVVALARPRKVAPDVSVDILITGGSNLITWLSR